MIAGIIKAVIKNRLGLTGRPGFVTFIITWRCNGRCVFCDVWKQRAGQHDEMTAEQIRAVFRQLPHMDVLRITGGEPFLRDDLAQVINGITAVNRPGMIHITTNGFLSKRICDVVESIEDVGKIHIKVSIDDTGEKHDTIRGVPGAYEKALATVRGLCDIRERRGLHVGVNQAIVSGAEMDAYDRLKAVMDPLNVPVYPCIANQPANSLYSDRQTVDPVDSCKTYGEFSPEQLDSFMKKVLADGRCVDDLKEQMVDRYHLRGLYNRLVHNRAKPHPDCVAINNHLRILPNGDVPVCLYNGAVIGNLVRQTFDEVWNGAEAQRQRKWVKNCPGCWQSCESVVNAIYTGDIWRGLIS
jgi:Fe-coproporphyrin III synthase